MLFVPLPRFGIAGAVCFEMSYLIDFLLFSEKIIVIDSCAISVLQLGFEGYAFSESLLYIIYNLLIIN